jgi:hypothetical protein
MVFESLITALKGRHFCGMKAQTAQLDAETRARTRRTFGRRSGRTRRIEERLSQTR